MVSSSLHNAQLYNSFCDSSAWKSPQHNSESFNNTPAT
uniref:Uncharacterized protein n=1 Tax=Anguilla anguilla TaxID=7936 RepID=A0A0E9VGE5_ANGAN